MFSGFLEILFPFCGTEAEDRTAESHFPSGIIGSKRAFSEGIFFGGDEGKGAEIFQILPFENEVYIVTLTGERLKSYLDNAGGIYYWGIDVNSIVDSEYYSFATVDYVYLGSYFAEYRNDTCIDTNELIRDVFIELILQSI